MRVPQTALGTIVGVLALAALGDGPGPTTADAAPDAMATATATSPRPGSYTRYTRRLEDETVRILTPEISGGSKTALASHSLDFWGSSSIGEWRQYMLRWVPTSEKALSVLVRRTEVLWAEERVDEPYGSALLQLGSVHAMQKGVVRVLAALGVAAPAPVSAEGIGAGAPAYLPTATPASTAAPASAPAALPRPTTARSAPVAAAPRRSAAPVAAAPTRDVAPARSPFELAAYQGALAKESYRILFPEIENGAQATLAARRNAMRNAPSVAEWKQLLSEANPAFAKAAAVLERRAEVLRGETKVLDAYESPHAQRAAVYGLQSGLEKILALYGK